MAQRFLDVDRATPYLLPPSVDEWIEAKHLARFVVDVVDQLDLSALERRYSGRGKKAYHPSVLVAVLFYGYATGVYASRALERASDDSVAFRYLCANRHPDHDTLAEFRKSFRSELSALFVQILGVAQQMGLLKVGQVALDGTKIKANASAHKALSWKHALKLEAHLTAEVAELLKKAERADASNLPDGLAPQDAARQSALRPAQARGRTGLRHHQADPAHAPIPAAWPRQGQRRVGFGVHGLQLEANAPDDGLKPPQGDLGRHPIPPARALDDHQQREASVEPATLNQSKVKSDRLLGAVTVAAPGRNRSLGCKA